MNPRRRRIARQRRRLRYARRAILCNGTTYSNVRSSPAPTLKSIKDALDKLKRLFPPSPGIIYVREDVWPKLERDCLSAMSAVGEQGTARGALEELFPALLGFPGCRIRIELRKYLPKPWMTDIELEALMGGGA